MVIIPKSLHSLAEEILESHRHRAHGDDAGFDAYKAHVYRVVNFARALTPDGPDRDDKLAIAAAFHDLAAFDTLDYLVPSIEAQDAWLQQTGREAWSDELALIVAEHHRLSAYGPTRPYAPLVEAVRQADLVDVSQGLIRFGLPRSYVKEVRAAFDAGVFFKRVIPLGTLRAVRTVAAARLPASPQRTVPLGPRRRRSLNARRDPGLSLARRCQPGSTSSRPDPTSTTSPPTLT